MATARVPAATLQRDISHALATDAAAASAMCGVTATGLTNVTVTADNGALPEFLGSGRARVRGTSVGSAAPMQCDGHVEYRFETAMSSTDPTVCVDVSLLVWIFAAIVLVSVETPGVHWAAPARSTGGSGTGHHSHHHHHY